MAPSKPSKATEYSILIWGRLHSGNLHSCSLLGSKLITILCRQFRATNPWHTTHDLPKVTSMSVLRPVRRCWCRVWEGAGLAGIPGKRCLFAYMYEQTNVQKVSVERRCTLWLNIDSYGVKNLFIAGLLMKSEGSGQYPEDKSVADFLEIKSKYLRLRRNVKCIPLSKQILLVSIKVCSTFNVLTIGYSMVRSFWFKNWNRKAKV